MIRRTSPVVALSWLWLVVGTAGAVAHEPDAELAPEAQVDVLTDPTAGDQVKSADPSWQELFQEEFVMESRAELVSESRALAQTILTQAAPKISNKLFWNVLASLKGAPIQYPNPGYDFKGCTDRVLAFVLFLGGVPQNKIYLCSRSLGNESPFIAQVLMHEAAHVRGYGNECDATKVEVGAMRHSGRALVFRNGYMEKCGIQ